MHVGDNIRSMRADWQFGAKTAENFTEHVTRSVPFYEEGHELICYLSDFFIKKDSTAYELGVSNGTLLSKLARYNAHKPTVEWIGIDNSPEMIKRAKTHCSEQTNISLRCDNVTNFSFEKSDMFISYYCIQFVPERYRQDLFNKLYERLNWGGALVLFEKVRGPDARFQDMMVSLYNDFKLRKGFTPEEIFNKSQSLKGVLNPFSTQGNLDLLERAGFKDVVSIMKYVCFEGFLAIK